ncbi:BamA/TamA family outer membrane protein [Mucilaginibacter mali]|uniref:BamA/TamA family outer membrane protein n=1 Tax=Mucilaginibacter mali TaxID=2740462 RepID=UPI001F025C0C|nr:BamA/TamA family outer membrane protein [Mucilaginibacter mali]
MCYLPFTLLAQDVIQTAKYVDTTGQTDLIDLGRSLFSIKGKRMKNKEGKNIYFSFLPISSAVPGGGKALITSTTAGFYLGPRDSTFLSSATFAPYFNFNGRFGIPLRSSLWLKNNGWNIQGDTRFLVYPQYTWGLGGNQSEDNKILVNYKYIRFNQAALKRVTNFLYAGIGYDLDYHIDISAEETNRIRSFTGYQYGAANDNNSFSSGATLNLLYDTRNNPFNPMPGCYLNVVYRYNSRMLGSQDSWKSLYVDARKYISLSNERKKNVLALWGYYWTTLNAGTPYLDLPSVGWDPYNRSGRGMDQNRYRGQGLIYLETEYRRDITRNGLFGYVLFASATSVTEAAGRNFKYINPAAGAGLRIKFNKGSDTNIAIDYGFSKGYNTFILSLGETF